MATRIPSTNTAGKAGLRNSDIDNRGANDGTVFSSMKEFWFWVAIVTLLIFCIILLSLGIIHVQKQLNKADAIILRLEQQDKKRKQPAKGDSDDGIN